MTSTDEPRSKRPRTPPASDAISEAATEAEPIRTGLGRPTVRLLVSVAARIIGITTALLLGYFLLPVTIDGEGSGAAILIGGIVIFVLVTIYQIKRILVDDHPGLRGVEAVATIIPLFIVVFAYSYVWMSSADPSRFSQPIDRTDGLYFVVTVLSTTGFGDITPVSGGARMVVTLQMLLDLVLIGVIAKLIMGASQAGVKRRRQEVQAGSEAANEPPADPET